MRGMSIFKKAMAALLPFLFVSCQQDLSRTQGPRVCFEDACVLVEVAQKEEELARGLQGRTSLPAGSGMLFIFPRDGHYVFWMKDTQVPLDILWIGEDRKVRYIEHNAQPCQADPCPTFDPGTTAAYVLEVNAGYASGHGIEKGDTAVFHLNE